MKGVQSYLPKNQPELKLISLEDVAVEMGPINQCSSFSSAA